MKKLHMLKNGHKQREGCRKGMNHRIKEQIRTELATEIVHFADIVLISKRRLDVRNATRKGFDTYRSVVKGEEERKE